MESTGSRNAGSAVAAQGLQGLDSVVVAHRLICSEACGILPDQGWNWYSLHFTLRQNSFMELWLVNSPRLYLFAQLTSLRCLPKRGKENKH